MSDNIKLFSQSTETTELCIFDTNNLSQMIRRILELNDFVSVLNDFIKCNTTIGFDRIINEIGNLRDYIDEQKLHVNVIEDGTINEHIEFDDKYFDMEYDMEFEVGDEEEHTDFDKIYDSINNVIENIQIYFNDNECIKVNSCEFKMYPRMNRKSKTVITRFKINFKDYKNEPNIERMCIYNGA